MQLTQSFADQMQQIHAQLGTDIAIISYINNNSYTILEVQSPLDTLKPGTRFNLGETYCAEVINQAATVSYEEIGKVRAMILHPVYTAMQLEAYIGVPLRYQGKIVGTLNFSGFGAKKFGFSEEDRMLVEALALSVEQSLMPEGERSH